MNNRVKQALAGLKGVIQYIGKHEINLD